ncbi:hypothetical protein [Mycobacterium sp.]|uniref:hypothetical protein n=1 Tax=Mycobacterium sp. TaxID=1785 RepID=UPI002DA1A5E9|nr:hypothetical protein [Mycobacterium sp.]
MRAHIRSSVIAGIAVAGVAALAITPLAPPPESTAPPTAVRDVRLTAAPALGAIPAAFIRNQFEYCSLICPFAVQGAITVPIAAAQAPATFLGSLASSGSLFKAIGTAAASVTGPANAAATPLFNNDVFLVVPKAFHALDVAIVEAFNVGAAVFTPGELLQAIQNARTNILGALDQPVGPPTTPTGARNILQVVTVEAVNVVTAIAFQAGELLLLGVIQTADAVAQELAQSGDPGAALSAGAAQAGKVINQSAGIVATAVDTAVTNIRNSLNDPFPSATPPEVTSTAVAVNDEPVKPDSDKPTEKRSDKKDSDSESEFSREGLRDVSREVPREADEQTEEKPKHDSPSDSPGKSDHDDDGSDSQRSE